MDDRDLMRVRVEALFTHDAHGRMLRSNEPDGVPAPRLFLGRTRSGHVFRLGQAVPDSLARRLAGIIDREPPQDDLRAPPVGAEALRDALERDAPIVRETAGPAYRFPDALRSPSIAVVSITAESARLVQETWPDLVLPDWQPCFAVVRDGAAVSVCFSARRGRQAAEAGVNTLPEFRGRGYAAAVTAAWGAAVRDLGLVPLYSTTWDNTASQGVARRAGLLMFGADCTWA